MKKITTQFFLFLFTFFCFTFISSGQDSKNRLMAWEVTSEKDATAYLVGSVHIVKPEIYPLDSVYYQLLEKSDKVGFEVNMDSLLIESQALLPKYGLYPLGETLENHLPKETLEKLESELKSLGIPLAMMMQMKPWVVSTSLTALQLQQSGYSTEGIDQHFFNRAKKAEKPVFGLETTELQMKIFDNMTDQEQIDFLEYSLENSSETINSMDEMLENWKKGDAEKLVEYMDNGLEQFSESAYFRIFTERNQNWVPQIEKFIEDGETVLIIVGAGHLVGKNSVNDLLEKKGYSVKQL